MKQVKIKDSDLNKGLESLLTKLGAVNKEKRRAYPSHVYMSLEDYAKVKKFYKKAFKKEYPGLNSKAIEASIGMELLNLGPSTILGKSIRPGYVLVNEDAIAAEEKEALEAAAREEAEALEEIDDAIYGTVETEESKPALLSLVNSIKSRLFGKQ